MSATAPVAEPTAGQARFRRILLASEGRPIPPAAVARTVELAEPGANVHVFTIARIHGTAFGMPSPGLFPNKKEWAAQRDIVGKTIKRLERKGLAADGHVLGTRNAWKKILEEAKKEGCEAIVMAADPDRNRMTANMMWSQEPQRVRRRAKLPVYLVVED
ncbi:MAG TPA: universal stress protein [Solirubrobacteraceae bacterium]